MDNKSRNRSMTLAFMGIMIALDVILVRFVSFEIPTMRIGGGFLSVILAGMYLGPLPAGIVGLVADILGMIIFPRGAYFPGFTVSAFLSYWFAGLMLEGKKSDRLVNVIVYAVASTLVIDTLLNTTWLVMMLHQNNFNMFWAVLAPRVPFQIVVTVLKIIFVPIIYRTLFKRFRARGVERSGIRGD